MESSEVSIQASYQRDVNSASPRVRQGGNANPDRAESRWSGRIDVAESIGSVSLLQIDRTDVIDVHALGSAIVRRLWTGQKVCKPLV